MNSSATVFIVDDDKLARESISALVKSASMAVEAFPSAEEFLAQFEPERPGCLVVDLRMPGMSGFELQQQLIKMSANIPLILVSAYTTTNITVRAMHGGAISVIEKPFREDELWDAITLALKRDKTRREIAAHVRELQARFDLLEDDERDILAGMIDGRSNKVIAADLDISLRTVESRRSSIFKKTGTTTIAELVKFCIELRTPPPPDSSSN